jgi:transposase
MNVIIGIDPHKATHTAVAIGFDEGELATVTVRATKQQTDRLVEWAKPFKKRTWAIESAGGLGYLLAQQLVDAGEHVLDVPATLASRVRVLGTGKSDKNDPNDARSVADAALRSPVGAGSKPCRCAAPIGQAQPGHRESPHQAGVPTPRPDRLVGCRRNCQGTQRF